MRNPNRVRKPKKKTIWSWCSFWLDMIEKNPAVRVAAGIGAVASMIIVAITFWHIRAEIDDRDDERKARNEERIDRALTRLRERMGGDIGKGWAINVLLNANYSTSTMDISCKAAGTYDDASEDCTLAPSYIGVDAGNADNKSSVTREMMKWFTFESIKESEFIEGNFNFSVVNQPKNYSKASFYNSTFIGSYIGIGSAGDTRLTAYISDSDLSFSYIRTPSRLILANNNISGTEFVDASDTDELITMFGNWAWADKPPLSSTMKKRMTFEVIPPLVDHVTDLTPVPWLKEVSLCDPAYRRSATPSRRFNWLGRKIEQGATGITPALRVTSPQHEICVTISVAEARRRYPDAYAAIQSRTDLTQ